LQKELQFGLRGLGALEQHLKLGNLLAGGLQR